MPKTVEISAKLPRKDGVEGRAEDKEATISVNCFGENLDEDRQLVGDDVIKSNYEGSVVITIQGGIRRALAAGKTPQEIQALYADYKPGVAVRRGVDPKAAYRAFLAGLSPEERKAELKALREAAGA